MAWSYHVLEQPGCGKMCLVGKGSIDVYLFPRCKERVDFEGFGGYGLWLIAPECVNYIRILWILFCVHRMMVTMFLLAVCVEYDLFWNLAWASHGSYHCWTSKCWIPYQSHVRCEGSFLLGNLGPTNLKIHRLVMSRFKMWSRNWTETLFVT